MCVKAKTVGNGWLRSIGRGARLAPPHGERGVVMDDMRKAAREMRWLSRIQLVCAVLLVVLSVLKLFSD